MAGGTGLASKTDIAEIADVLAHAFDSDPELRAFIDGRHRKARLRAYLEAEARLILDTGGVIDLYRNTDGKAVGAAVWDVPDAAETLLQTARRGPAMLAAVGLRGLFNWLTYRSDFKRFQPVSPHWHLVRLATEASSRGQGIATALLAGRLDMIDAEGRIAHLEASNIASARLYERFGFAAVGEFRLPPDTMIVPMTRPARQRAVMAPHP